ncbi:hypothetical protein PR003_g1621 [Phytophthora rubi]|uniref:SWIM-type domain-containing protein n=1 Tax=Phytophthora rubi TaxID=129364 RepID=A0A6A3NQ50_9STRA|nr:hypothetical protein PR002_g1492 [Phytophthora rubi]KAE9357788.1 hypothetical protein PR003_g1621 [Phytophthora rubi]
MARSDCESDYKVFEKELERTKPAAVAYLNGIDKTHWVKYKYQEHFKLPTYGETTSNLTEQANSWIGNECRSAKPLDAFALYFRKLSELVSGKRQMGVDWLAKRTGAELVPQLPSERKSLVIAAELCKVTPCMEGAYNVIFLGKSKHPGFIHPWRLVDLPARECTCGNWQDKEFPCVHAVATSVKEGQALDTLYYVKRMSIDHFRETYMAAFRPWPTDVTLGTDLTIRVPPIQSDPPELGKRGLKPGPKPKHKRKKTKSGN